MDFTINHADDAQVAALKLECARLTFENEHLRSEKGLYPRDRPVFTAIEDLPVRDMRLPEPLGLLHVAHCSVTIDPVLGQPHVMARTHGAKDGLDLSYSYYMEDPRRLEPYMRGVVLGDMHKRLILDLAKILGAKT